jgi:hypothetical protein
VLFALVKEHLEELLRHAREAYEGPLPRYVEREFRKYLECGDFSRGFVHVRCPTCGEDLAVAFRCKLHGLRARNLHRRVQASDGERQTLPRGMHRSADGASGGFRPDSRYRGLHADSPPRNRRE